MLMLLASSIVSLRLLRNKPRRMSLPSDVGLHEVEDLGGDTLVLCDAEQDAGLTSSESVAVVA